MSVGRVVALTGGTGFIGPYLVRSLTAAGWRVKVLVRPGRQHALAAGVEVIGGVLEDEEALARLLD
ncbi:MAG: NAD-dependent epimerase/dehydratase family protein, partial [Magnetospirillum sp.]